MSKRKEIRGIGVFKTSEGKAAAALVAGATAVVMERLRRKRQPKGPIPNYWDRSSADTQGATEWQYYREVLSDRRSN